MSEAKAPKGWVKISEFEKLTGLQSKTVRQAIGNGKIPPKYVRTVGEGPTAPLYINPKAAASEWMKNLNAGHHLTKPTYDALAAFVAGKKPKKKTAAQPKDSKKPKQMTYAEAQTAERIAKAELATLELEEKKGTLVPKAEVDAELFAAGRELRDAILAVPDREIDNILASGSRAKARIILYNALAFELRRIGEIIQGDVKI